MIRFFHCWQQLFVQKRRLVSFCGAVFLVGLFSPALRAQLNPVYSYSEYWCINGWNTEPFLPNTQLQISKTGNSVSVGWPYSVSNAVLQTTTNLPLEASWTTLTNQPVESVGNNSCTMTLLAQNEQQYFRLAGMGMSRVPLFSFAIFYDGQLEFTQSPSLTIRGRVHANGPICLGAAPSQVLRFIETVTTASSIVYSNLGGYSSFSTPVYDGIPAQRTNTPTLKLSGITNNRVILELPTFAESPTNGVGLERYYNKAALVLIVSNTAVMFTVKNVGALAGISTNFAYNSAAPSALERNNLAGILPFLSLTNRFYENREGKWVMPTQLDVGVLKNWLATNTMVLAQFPVGSAIYPTVLYVGDFRTVTNLHAVRLTNGSIIPTNGPSHTEATGFTFATPNPLYVWGNYNCPNPSHLGTTNTTMTFPASLVCDAITVLSANWTDAYGNSTTLGSRNAASTTINAAIIAGSVYSTGPSVGQFSGGINNFTRLLEDWSGRTLTMNTAIVNLCNSVLATNQFQLPGVYYNAPTRNFNFDKNFKNMTKLPPGTPIVTGTIPVN